MLLCRKSIPVCIINSLHNNCKIFFMILNQIIDYSHWDCLHLLHSAFITSLKVIYTSFRIIFRQSFFVKSIFFHNTLDKITILKTLIFLVLDVLCFIINLVILIVKVEESTGVVVEVAHFKFAVSLFFF